METNDTEAHPAPPSAPRQMRKHRLYEPMGVINMQCLCVLLKQHAHTEFVKVWKSPQYSKDDSQ